MAHRIFLGCPTADGTLHGGTARAMWQYPTKNHKVYAIERQLTLTAANCNRLLCEALNLRVEQLLTSVAILHSDIEPEINWLDKLAAIADAEEAAMVSAVVPIKTDDGCVSTALATADPWQALRLTTAQVYHKDFPDTFDVERAALALESLPEPLRLEIAPRLGGLLCNTGCVLIDLNRLHDGLLAGAPLWFDDRNRISLKNGRWVADCIPEDWWFSRAFAQSGLKVVATKALSVNHKGVANWRAGDIWGNDRDPGYDAWRQTLS